MLYTFSINYYHFILLMNKVFFFFYKPTHISNIFFNYSPMQTVEWGCLLNIINTGQLCNC